jgi:hypothetical protein
METNHDVFISHSSADSKLAFAICHYLEEKGIRCWIAPRDVQGGIEYAESIILGIRSCKIMVVVFSENANNSLFVKSEVERAFNYKSIIIPFKVEDIIPSATLELFLSSVHWLDAVKGSAEDYFDLLYQNCIRNRGTTSKTLISETIKRNLVEKKSIQNHDVIGYYELDPIAIDAPEFKIVYEHRRYDFFDSGMFLNSYRMIISPAEERHEGNSEETTIEYEESFLCQDEGTWKIEDEHLIVKRINSTHQPDAEQTLSNRIFNLVSKHFDKEEISKITLFDSDKFESVDLDENKTFNVYKNLHYLNRKTDNQENESWLKNVEAKRKNRKDEEFLIKAILESEAYYGGYIDDLNEYIEAVANCFNKDYTCVNFNGSLWSQKNDWKPLNNGLLDQFDLPKEVQNNIIIIAQYKISQGFSFFKNEIELYFAAYNHLYSSESEGYVLEEDSKGRLIKTDRKIVESNLMFIRVNDNTWSYSLSCWIDKYRKLPCVSLIKSSDKVLKINSYQQLSKEGPNPNFSDEIELNKNINAAILRLWEKLSENSAIPNL